MEEPISLAEYYHEQTKYSEELFRLSPPPDIDFAQQPHPFKEYQSDRTTSLVPYLPFQSFPLTGEEIDPTAEEPSDPLLPALSRLLYFTNGVTAVVRTENGVHLFRAAPSAGALYPTELYVVAQGIAGLEDGLHNYSVRKHELVPVFDAELVDELGVCCFGHPAVAAARAIVVMTGVYRRSSWRYHDRAYRRILLDTGHVLGNLELVAAAEGLVSCAIGSFADEALNRLLFLDSREEGVLVVVPLIESDSSTDSKAAGVQRLVTPARRSSPESELPDPEEELLVALHRGSSIDLEELDTVPLATRSPATTPEARSVALSGQLPDLEPELYQTIMQRRSTRLFAGVSIDAVQLARVLDFGYRIAGVPGEQGGTTLQAPELLRTHVVVLDVDGIDAGVYEYGHEAHELRARATGDFRPQVQRLSLNQQVTMGVAAVIVHTADLPGAVRAYGNRAYRHLHLDAGTIGERLQLAAIRIGLGASGIGGFLDDEVDQLLRLPCDHAVLYLNVLGVPAAIV